MPRALRLESENACYHVINRGNYKSPLFRAAKTKLAFLLCLDEACHKTRWRVHAWCLMSTHFHLAITTPEANLAAGMHWLQCTFATRFNRLRNERGHLFKAGTTVSLSRTATPSGQFATTSTSIPYGHISVPQMNSLDILGPVCRTCFTLDLVQSGMIPSLRCSMPGCSQTNRPGTKNMRSIWAGWPKMNPK